MEGAEAEVIRGAEATLRASAGFAVNFEAHPLVAGRTGVDPIEVCRQVNAIRPCVFRVCELPGLQLDLQRPFFEQAPAQRNYDLVATQLEP